MKTTAPFYKVITHSLSAYGGADKAAARAMFEHQKKLIEQGKTQAHEVTLLEDNEAIDRFTLEEEEQNEHSFTASELAVMHSLQLKGCALTIFTPKEMEGMKSMNATNLETFLVEAGRKFIAQYTEADQT